MTDATMDDVDGFTRDFSQTEFSDDSAYTTASDEINKKTGMTTKKIIVIAVGSVVVLFGSYVGWEYKKYNDKWAAINAQRAAEAAAQASAPAPINNVSATDGSTQVVTEEVVSEEMINQALAAEGIVVDEAALASEMSANNVGDQGVQYVVEDASSPVAQTAEETVASDPTASGSVNTAESQIEAAKQAEEAMRIEQAAKAQLDADKIKQQELANSVIEESKKAEQAQLAAAAIASQPVQQMAPLTSGVKEVEVKSGNINARISLLEAKINDVIEMLTRTTGQAFSEYKTRKRSPVYSSKKKKEAKKAAAKVDKAKAELAALKEPKTSSNAEGGNENVVSANMLVSGTTLTGDIKPASMSLYAIIPGRAWLKDNLGNRYTVIEGETLPGYGVVKSINAEAGLVTTNSGDIR